MNRIKSGDMVVIIAGKSKGHVGKVLKVVGERVVVEGGNLIKKHTKPNPHTQTKGGIVTKEAALHVSNVAHFNPTTKKPGKVGFKILKDGDKTKKVRYFKSNDEMIDPV